jgi:hypothetical protein
MRITGTVRNRSGVAVGGLDVRAFDKDFRSQQEVGKTRTSADGRYIIEYTREKFKRAEKRSADVFIEVRPRKKGRPVRSPVRYNVPEVLVVDLVLDDDFFGEAEFTRLRGDIVALTVEKVDIRSLEDTAEHDDVSFLSAELDVPGERIVHFIIAHRLEHAAKIPADFFYALLRMETLWSFSPSRLHAIRFVIGLDVDVRTLLDEIVLLPEEKVAKAIDVAIKRGIVDQALKGKLANIIRKLKGTEAKAKQADTARTQEAFTRLLGPILEGGGIEALAEVLSQEHLGHIPLLVERVQSALAKRSAKVSDETRATLELAQFFGTDGPFFDGVRGHLKVATEAEVRKLAAFDDAEWGQDAESRSSRRGFWSPGSQQGNDHPGGSAPLRAVCAKISFRSIHLASGKSLWATREECARAYRGGASGARSRINERRPPVPREQGRAGREARGEAGVEGRAEGDAASVQTCALGCSRQGTLEGKAYIRTKRRGPRPRRGGRALGAARRDEERG